MSEPSDETFRELGRRTWEVFLDWRPIDETMARSLEEITLVPAEVWLRLETDYAGGARFQDR